MKRLAMYSLIAAAIFAIGWTSAGDVKITGTLKTKIQEFYGTTGTNFVRVPDNAATALTIEDTTNGGDLITITTTNGAETITSSATLKTNGWRAGSVEIVSAAGSSKTDCTQLTKELSVVNSATALQGVCLDGLGDVLQDGTRQKVANITTVSVVAYPRDSSNDSFRIVGAQGGAMSADEGWVIGPKGSLDCEGISSSAWLCSYELGASTASITAAGTNQATFTAMTSANLGANVAISGCDGTKGVTLPSGSNMGCIGIVNLSGTATCGVAGHNSDNDAIGELANDATYTLAAGATAVMCSLTSGTAWWPYAK